MSSFKPRFPTSRPYFSLIFLLFCSCPPPIHVLVLKITACRILLIPHLSACTNEKTVVTGQISAAGTGLYRAGTHCRINSARWCPAGRKAALYPCPPSSMTTFPYSSRVSGRAHTRTSIPLPQRIPGQLLIRPALSSPPRVGSDHFPALRMSHVEPDGPEATMTRFSSRRRSDVSALPAAKYHPPSKAASSVRRSAGFFSR